MVMTAGSSRKGNLRTTRVDEEDTEVIDSNTDFRILSTGDGAEFESDSKVPTSQFNYHKFFNESDIKYQNADNYYKRKPHRP